MNKNILKNIALLLGSLFVALFLCEILLRTVIGDDYLIIEPVLKSNKLVYEPNQTSEFKMFGEIDTTIKINSRGFRDSEYQATKGDNTIVVLGDSFTEGWGVDSDKSYVKQLEQMIIHDGHRISHIYNAGHYGTNPKNYTAVYDAYFAKDESVSTVVMGFFMGNDIIEESTPETMNVPEQSITQKLKYYASRYSHVYNFIRRQVRYSRNLENLFSLFGLTNPPRFGGNIYKNQKKEPWSYTANYIYEFYKSVKKSGKHFLLVLIPLKEMVDKNYLDNLIKITNTDPVKIELFGFRDFITNYCKEKQIPVLDLTPDFIERFTSTSNSLYFLTDVHWNAEGHKFAAEKILQSMEKLGYLGSAQ